MAEDQGVDFPERFSAADMIRFKDPDLIPEMLNAVAVLKQHGRLNMQGGLHCVPKKNNKQRNKR